MHRNIWSWVPSPSVHRASTEAWRSPPTDPKWWLISPIRAYSLLRHLGKAMRKPKQAEHLPLSSSTTGFKEFPPVFEGFWFPWWLSGKEPTCQEGDLGLIPGLEDPQEEEMATHSTILPWDIPWTEKAWQATVHGTAKESHTTLWLNNNNGRVPGRRSQLQFSLQKGKRHPWFKKKKVQQLGLGKKLHQLGISVIDAQKYCSAVQQRTCYVT